MAKIAKPLKSWIKRRTTAGRLALAEHAPDWARQAFGPLANHLDLLFVDHGILRLLYLNRHRLGANAWRSAQPAPHDIANFKRLGIKTVVNLRGPRLSGSYWLEEDACERHGIKLENFQVRSRAAPSLEELYGARDLFGRVEYPMLMHCKSGADRAGLMSVLYMHLVEGLRIETALDQLSLRFGHIRQAETGVLDHFFETYLAENRSNPIAFFDWVATKYDPDAVKNSFTANGFASRIVNDVLRRE